MRENTASLHSFGSPMHPSILFNPLQIHSKPRPSVQSLELINPKQRKPYNNVLHIDILAAHFSDPTSSHYNL